MLTDESLQIEVTGTGALARAIEVQVLVDKVGSLSADEFDEMIAALDIAKVPILRAERVRTTRAINDHCFVDLVEQVGHLYFDVVGVFDESLDAEVDVPAWRVIESDWGYSFTQFAKDHLGLPPSKASQYKNMYDILIREMGYSRDNLLNAGESNLRLALATLRRLHAKGERDEELERILFEETGPRYAEIEAMLVEKVETERKENGEAPAAKIEAVFDRKEDDRTVFKVTVWREELAYNLAEVSVEQFNEQWDWDDLGWAQVVDAFTNSITGKRVNP